MGRVVRDRAGKAILFADGLDAKYVAEAAGEFLRHDISRVFFRKSKGGTQKQFALAAPPGVLLSNAERAAIEALAWQRRRERGGRRKKVMSGGGVDM